MKNLILFIILYHFLESAMADTGQADSLVKDRGGKYATEKHKLTIAINDTTVTEADPAATLTVSLSKKSVVPIKIHYHTIDGTAIHGRDYKKKSGRLIIPAGSLSACISILIIKDNRDEPTEYFKVKLKLERNEHGAIVGDATGRVTIRKEKKITTTSYVELNNLVVVYRNTNGGTIDDTSLLSPALQQARDFYWRHSHMAFNIKWTVYVIDDYLDRVHENGYVFPHEVDTDLRSRGFADGSFDAVVAVVRGSGAYSWGVNTILGTGGYSQVPWWDEYYLSSWFFVHEFNHIVDAMFANSGHLDYPINHPGAARAGGEFVPNSGPNWDLNAGIVQYWERSKWLDLQRIGNWGSIKSSVDNDLDTIPDNDPNVPLDEERFGSSRNEKDTDHDGLSDLQEAMAGIFEKTDPVDEDTDGDGLPDGEDSEPVYPLKTTVPEKQSLGFDQDITEWPLAGHYFFNQPGGSSSSLFLGYTKNLYTRNYFYLGFSIPVEMTSCRIVIDANNDGIFYGSDNIEVIVNGNTIESVKLFDAASVPPGDISDHIETPLSSLYFAGALKTGPGWSSYQLIIPQLPQYDLSLAAGETIGIYIEIPGYGIGTMFEPDDFISVTMGESASDPITQAKKAIITSKETNQVLTKLTATVYPNPSAQSFILQWKGSDQPVSITITDALGRVIEKRTGLHSTGSMQTGNNFRSGVYYAEVIQGTAREVVQFIKN